MLTISPPDLDRERGPGRDPGPAGDPDTAFQRDVLDGMAQPQKTVPARWLYDFEGSVLFEEITRVPEYYPTRTEVALLEAHAADVARRLGNPACVVEFGSGSSLKTRILLNRMPRATYVPIDISGAFLADACEGLACDFPDLRILPVEGDFTAPLALPDEVRASGAAMLGFFPGSTIGNLEPAEAVDLLRAMGRTLGAGACLLIGIDRVKSRDRLIAAYDDAQGVTARFNLNLLKRINRELAGTLPLDAFRHDVRWNERYGRIEMHLTARAPLHYEISGSHFALEYGESIHTENCHKYRAGEMRLLLAAGGWDEIEHWTDTAGDYSLVLARRTDPSAGFSR